MEGDRLVTPLYAERDDRDVTSMVMVSLVNTVADKSRGLGIEAMKELGFKDEEIARVMPVKTP